jgi:hypothetical protein
MPWRPRPYEPGETAIVNGEIHVFTPVITPDGSQFFADDWAPYRRANTGFPLYLNANTYLTGDYVEFANRLFKQINVNSVQGIAPLNHPDSANYWVEISAPNGEFGLDYLQLFNDNQGEVVGLKNTVWQIEHEGRLRLFKAVFSSQPGQTFLSTDFAAELAANSWIEVAGGTNNNLPMIAYVRHEFVVYFDSNNSIPELFDLNDYSTNGDYVLNFDPGDYCIEGYILFKTPNYTGQYQGEYELRVVTSNGDIITYGSFNGNSLSTIGYSGTIYAPIMPISISFTNQVSLQLKMRHFNNNNESWKGIVVLKIQKVS